MPSPELPRPNPGRSWPWALIVVLVALARFGFNLPAEPHFADESAFLARTYYADLWIDGSGDEPDWLTYPALDQPPLPKYLMGLALRWAGYRRPGPASAQAWYQNINQRIGTPKMLVVARWPVVVLGALGCGALFLLGARAFNRRAGVVAALLLMVNPLYTLLARRAMGDVPAESLILATAALGLGAWSASLAGRGGPIRWLARWGTAGILAGLAVLAKLNGGLGLMILGGWMILTAALRTLPIRRALGVEAGVMMAGLVAFATFVALNPTMTARPEGVPVESWPEQLVHRAQAIVKLRVDVPRGQQLKFPEYALKTPLAKIAAVVVQGFGRFGPFGPRSSDSTRRFDWRQDWGALIWGPWVALGVAWTWAEGRRQYRAGEPPTAWAVLVQAAVALATVTAFLPLAWDRFFLSIQPGSALLAAGAAVAGLDCLVGIVTARCSRRREATAS